ncbi:MAG: hypothetical protein NW216_08245 [Hyphomicrobium sp.]|nr:hypothetical protein [Hyphomicrobium sp.]
MGMQTLMTAARAAGFAMAPPVEVFEDGGHTAPKAVPIRATVPAVARTQSSRSRSWRRLIARTRARFHHLAQRRRAEQWRGFVTALLHGPATPA